MSQLIDAEIVSDSLNAHWLHAPIVLMSILNPRTIYSLMLSPLPPSKLAPLLQFNINWRVFAFLNLELKATG
jgi:hypothetical protein